MTIFSEKRKSKRKNCNDLWIEVTIDQYATNTPIVVKIDNLGDGGACIISSHVFELGQIINFPKSLRHKSGTVVWTCQSKTEYKAGVQFHQN